ncbi:MAG: helix-turn-helix domain-containing protein [Acidimicrobiales bacterium]
MRTTLRQARESANVSMSTLATRLGVSLASVSTLELNDERGVAKTETVERALAALGLARWDVVLPADELAKIIESAKETAANVKWTMALEAQNVPAESLDAVVARSIARKVAERI